MLRVITLILPMVKKPKVEMKFSNQTKATDYVGNIIYENDAWKRILVDGGYVENGQYHFYIQDHQGNNRVVAKANGTVIQTNCYYPYGITFTEDGTHVSIWLYYKGTYS